MKIIYERDPDGGIRCDIRRGAWLIETGAGANAGEALAGLRRRIARQADYVRAQDPQTAATAAVLVTLGEAAEFAAFCDGETAARA